LRQGCFVFPLFALSFLELFNKCLKNPKMWPSGGGFPYVLLFPRGALWTQEIEREECPLDALH
jgi:hypothetical protein